VVLLGAPFSTYSLLNASHKQQTISIRSNIGNEHMFCS
jgi:hypothetical protein